MKFHVPNAVSRRAALTVLSARKNSPTLLFGAGIVLGVGTVVSACRSTLKVEEVLVEHQKTAADIRSVVHAQYSEQDRKHDMVLLHVKTVLTFTKLYGPSLVMGIGSVACLTQSHRILQSRNAGLAAAYATIDKAFNEYRRRVGEEVGEERELEIYRGVEEETVTIEGKNGPKKVKQKVSGGKSKYARFFGVGNKNWNANPSYNDSFLRLQQNWANDRLKARGHLFLNELYEELGLDHTPEGAVVGWLWDHPEAKDGFVDLGIWSDRSMQQYHEFMIGQNDGIWLDFNVDGPIWNLIGNNR